MTDEKKCSLCGKEISGDVTREVELTQRQGGKYLTDDRHEVCLACFGKLSSLFLRNEVSGE